MSVHGEPLRRRLPLRRAWTVLLLDVVCGAAALITGRDLYAHLAYLLTAALLLSFWWGWSATRGLRFRRYTRTSRAQVGRPLEERFTLINRSRWPKLGLVVYDHSELPDHRAGQVLPYLRPRGEHGWTVRTLCTRRGRFRLGPVTIAGGDPLGLFEFRRRLPESNLIVVYPATVPVRGFPHPVGHLPGGDALRRRTHHVTTNAAGVRDYVPGDGFNRIHWPSTARQRRLIVKEFELDPRAEVWLFLDVERGVHVRLRLHEAERLRQERRTWWERLEHLELEPSTEEYAVTAAASVARHFIRGRRAVGLVAYGQRREVIPAGRGERQLGKILDTLAALRATGDVPFAQVLSAEGRRLPRGALVVAISPSIRAEWVEAALSLGRAGRNVVAILVDGAAFGGPVGAAALGERLRAAGVPALVLRRRADLVLDFPV